MKVLQFRSDSDKKLSTNSAHSFFFIQVIRPSWKNKVISLLVDPINFHTRCLKLIDTLLKRNNISKLK